MELTALILSAINTALVFILVIPTYKMYKDNR